MTIGGSRKLYREIEAELRRLDVSWQIVSGSNHYRVMIEGTQVAVFSHGQGSKGKDCKNILSKIRQYMRVNK